MKKLFILEVLIIAFCLICIVYSWVTYLQGNISGDTVLTINCIVTIGLVLFLYLVNYKYSAYGGKFKDHYGE